MSAQKQSFSSNFLMIHVIGLGILFLLWLFTLIILILNSMAEWCTYGTSCIFNTVNDTCSLFVDNRTIIIDKTTASPSALYYCYNNSTITCYYAKDPSSIGDILGDYYKTNCQSGNGIVVVEGLIFAMTCIPLLLYFGYHLTVFINERKKKRDLKPEANT